MFGWFKKPVAEVNENHIKFSIINGKIMCDISIDSIEEFSKLTSEIISGSLNISLLELIEGQMADNYPEEYQYLLQEIGSTLPEEEVIVKPSNYGKIYGQ